MYARTNTGGAHGDFQDRNGVNYGTSTESFGHCSQLFWKKDPNDSGVRKPAATTRDSDRSIVGSRSHGLTNGAPRRVSFPTGLFPGCASSRSAARG